MGRIPDLLVSLAVRALENRWVTIGAKADSKRPGKKKGGTPVELDGEGKITKGPAALTGKRPSELSQSHLFTGQDHKSQRKLFAEPGDPPPPPPIDETPKAPAPAAKKEPKPRAKKPLSMSLLAVIRREGGISSGDFEHADFKEFGLLGALNKKGLSLDDMAATMVRQGHITVPMGKSSPSDHLLQLLKKKTNSLLAADTAEYDKDYEAYMQAREEAQSDGYPEEQLAEASGRGEEAGDQESKDRLFDEIFGGDGSGGEEAGRDEPGDLAGDSAEPAGGVDTSFDFGPAAAPKVEEKPKAAKPKKAAADKPKGATLQPDGTLKTKDGTVWTRAKAGGEHSPVTDKHYKGGQWMPIHGMSKPKAEKPAEEPVGTQAVEPGENDKEQAEDKGPRMREPRQLATPEEIAQKQKDQEHWDAVKQGPLGRIRGWMGDFPNKIGAQASINSKEWQKLADEMGPEKVKQIADEMERRRLDRLSEIYDEGKAKGHIKNETKKDFLNAYKKIWDKDNWGLGQRHVAKNPHSARAAMHLYNEMGEPQTPQSLRELNDYLAGVQNVQDGPAAPAPAPPAIEPQTPAPPPATNLFGQPEPTKPQPATTQGLFGEQVPVEDPKVKPRETIADQAEKGLDWLDQKQDPRTDGTGEMFGGLFSPGRTSGATEPEAGPVAPPAVEPSPSVTKPKVTPPAPKTPYAQRRGSVNFSPVTGPTGHKLVGYNWEHDKVDMVDDRGENRTRKVSAWDRSTQADETNRPIVHNFTVEAPDGTTKTVSLETAARMLGFDSSGDEPKAKFQSAVSAAKTLAKMQMERAELVQRADRWKKDKADVDRQVEALPDDQIEEVPDTMGRPEYRVFRWKNQPEISIRRKLNQPDADREEAKRQARWALADSEMEKRGHKEKNFKPNTAKIDGDIKKAQEKLDNLTKQASQPKPEAGPAVPPTVEPSPSAPAPKATSLPDRIKNLNVLLNKTRSSANAKALRTAIDQLERKAKGPVAAPASKSANTQNQDPAKASKYPRRFIIMSPSRGGRSKWDITGGTDDILDHSKNSSSYGTSYYDTKTNQYVKPGKKGPVKANAPQGYPSSPETMKSSLEDSNHTKTWGEIAQGLTDEHEGLSPSEVARSEAYFKDLHRKGIITALSLGEKVPDAVLKDYPDLQNAYRKQPTTESRALSNIRQQLREAFRQCP